MEDIDTKTRKILTLTGNFHRNSSVDRLYSPRKDGGRGLINIVDTFISRIVSLSEHLRDQRSKHKYLEEVYRHETPRIIRLAKELYDVTKVQIEEDPNPKKTSRDIRDSLKEGHTKNWKEKPQHGYLSQKQEKQNGYDKEKIAPTHG